MVTNELYLRGRKKDVNALLNEIISGDELTFVKLDDFGTRRKRFTFLAILASKPSTSH
jgi:hypothetical protein